MFIPTNALIDSQAGSAFYWHVQPCRAIGNCRSLEHAKHAFNKISNPVELLTPTQDSSFANSVTFTWRDYLQTNTSAPRDPSGVGSVAADVEAMTYRVQVDDDPNFQSPLETAVVDQTTYTSPGTTYPEGPLYWRVQAIDGSSNPLTWSTPGRFAKRSPAVTLSSPDRRPHDQRQRAAALGAARLRGALRGRGLQERRHDRPERRTWSTAAAAGRRRSRRRRPSPSAPPPTPGGYARSTPATGPGRGASSARPARGSGWSARHRRSPRRSQTPCSRATTCSSPGPPWTAQPSTGTSDGWSASRVSTEAVRTPALAWAPSQVR